MHFAVDLEITSKKKKEFSVYEDGLIEKHCWLYYYRKFVHVLL